MPRPLGELEDAVMTRVWQWNRPVTVREVLEDLQRERSIAYTTVMTVMDNLHQKGWVRREVDGRAYRYTAVSTRAAYSAALMNEAWSRSDNPAAALVAFFGMMSAEQREALRDAMRIVRPGRPETSPLPEREAPDERPDIPSDVPARPPAGEPKSEPANGPAGGREAGEGGESAAGRPARQPADQAVQEAGGRPARGGGRRPGERAGVPADDAGPASGR
ncbi:BlaI/MecI/CopY family transcriptional regulator [Streptomyces sp. NPDC047985]|uniref:BlaI/MecI/CopY family transcriptional regulator n=1 Tax=Streptomyces sp. NPDC047985 TaxID=3155384 RepID=UPI00342EE832